MKQDDIIYARISRELRRSLERERLRMSKTIGAKVKTSAVIRSLLERALRESQPRIVG